MPTTSISEPVVIAGGGPVGLTAGVRLGSLGVRVIVLEAEDEPKTDWRASTFHCATLEVLEPTGIVPDMLALGLQVPSYQLRDRSSGIVAEFEFSALGDETAYPYRLQLNQQKVVGLLLERLKSLENVDLRFGRRLSGLSEHGSGVVARVTRGNGGSSGQGSEEEIEASFLIGADGAASTVRRCLGVGFPGSTYPERFLIVSIEEDLSDRLDDLAYVNYVADPVEWLFILRTPESWRVLFPIPSDESDEQALSTEAIDARLQGVASSPRPYTVIDRQLYKVHQRVADSFAVGKVLLMGDAAHINSPIGGVGLNAGIHDASDASVRIARVLLEGANPSDELKAYSEVRRRVALDYVQRDTHGNTARLAESDGERRWRELSSMAQVASDPDQARAHLRRVSLLEPFHRYGIGRLPGELVGSVAT